MKSLPLATTAWDEREHAALQRVVKSGLFTMGSEVASFEKEFAYYLGVDHCVMVNSGSSANLLAVASLFFLKDDPLKRGDEVIVPSVSWSTTYFPLHQYGLKLKFVDVDKETLNMDLEQIHGALSNRTRLIFAVNLLGNPLDYHQFVCRLARRVEDRCIGFGCQVSRAIGKSSTAGRATG